MKTCNACNATLAPSRGKQMPPLPMGTKNPRRSSAGENENMSEKWRVEFRDESGTYRIATFDSCEEAIKKRASLMKRLRHIPPERFKIEKVEVEKK